jgi:hypothetical protein
MIICFLSDDNNYLLDELIAAAWAYNVALDFRCSIVVM